MSFIHSKGEAKGAMKVLAELEVPCSDEKHNGWRLRRRWCNDCVHDLTYQVRALLKAPENGEVK